MNRGSAVVGAHARELEPSSKSGTKQKQTKNIVFLLLDSDFEKKNGLLLVDILNFFHSAEYVCGGTFTENGGEITSPFYPKNYPESTTCIFDIRFIYF